MTTPVNRALVIAATIATVGLLGNTLRELPGRGVELESPSKGPSLSNAAAAVQIGTHDSERSELDLRFEQATVMLHAKRYEYALKALDRAIELAPNVPEAHVNRGFALIGLSEPAQAAQAFERALELRPTQVNAYYGLAVAQDELGDRPAALGSMRTFVHLTSPTDPFLRKSRAALWEWQASAPAGSQRGEPN
jgi:tetratricopeptide (TPR) repeat protein